MIEVVAFSLANGHREVVLVEDWQINGQSFGILNCDQTYCLFARVEFKDTFNDYLKNEFLGFNNSLDEVRNNFESFIVKRFNNLFNMAIVNGIVTIKEVDNNQFVSGKSRQFYVKEFLVDEIDVEYNKYNYDNVLFNLINRLLYIKYNK